MWGGRRHLLGRSNRNWAWPLLDCAHSGYFCLRLLYFTATRLLLPPTYAFKQNVPLICSRNRPFKADKTTLQSRTWKLQVGEHFFALQFKESSTLLPPPAGRILQVSSWSAICSSGRATVVIMSLTTVAKVTKLLTPRNVRVTSTVGRTSSKLAFQHSSASRIVHQRTDVMASCGIIKRHYGTSFLPLLCYWEVTIQDQIFNLFLTPCRHLF